MGTKVDFKMVFEGQIYIAPAGTLWHNDTKAVELVNRTGSSVTPGFEEVDATMKRNNGVQAFVHGLATFEASFTLFDITQKTTVVNGESTTVTETEFDDIKMIRDAIGNRNEALTFFFIPYDTSLRGYYGDMILFAAEGNKELGEIQGLEITVKPFAGGTGMHKYNPANAPT